MAKRNLVYAFVRMLGFLLLKMLFALEVRGEENLPLKGGLILAANHSSYLDPPAVSVSLPRQLHFLAKEELFEIRSLSWLIRQLNVLPLSRGKVSSRTMRKSIDILEQGGALMLFPEGTRIATEEIGGGKRGVGFLSCRTKVPVVPVLIEGTHKALAKGARWISPAKVKVTFGRPMYPQELSLETRGKKEVYQIISDRVMNEIKQLRR